MGRLSDLYLLTLNQIDMLLQLCLKQSSCLLLVGFPLPHGKIKVLLIVCSLLVWNTQILLSISGLFDLL